MHYRGMDLLHLNQRPNAPIPGRCSKSAEQQCAIAFDIGFGVVLSEAEIQRSSAITGGGPALASAEAVYEPR
jgi:hypothetical protein